MVDQLCSTKASNEDIDGSKVGHGRQTESLLLAQRHQGKKDVRTGGSKPWQSMLILT